MRWWYNLVTALSLPKSPLLSKIKHSSHNWMAFKTKPVLRRSVATAKPMLIADVVNSSPVLFIIALVAVAFRKKEENIQILCA